MLTRREMMAALPALAAMGAPFAAADDKPVMGSRVFDWNSIPVKTTSYGTVRSFFSSPTATLENLELHVTTLNPGQQPHKPHRHPNEELIIIRQGTVKTLSNGEWKRVGPGSVIFNASNQLHGLENIGKEPAIYHVINWKSAATPAA
jgi:XRE family transcriptional regulator, regulator of sulfur utilization